MASKTSAIISTIVGLAVGIGVYFFIKDTLVKTGQENFIPFLTIGIITTIPIAFAITRWEDKLMSIKLVNTTITFFKKTQWLWFAVIIAGIIILNVI